MNEARLPGAMLNDLTPELKAAFERVNETLVKVQEARQLAKSCAELLRLPGSHPDFLNRARDCASAQEVWDQASRDYEEANVALMKLLGLEHRLPSGHSRQHAANLGGG